jgi:hypothetical protein
VTYTKYVSMVLVGDDDSRSAQYETDSLGNHDVDQFEEVWCGRRKVVGEDDLGLVPVARFQVVPEVFTISSYVMW